MTVGRRGQKMGARAFFGGDLPTGRGSNAGGHEEVQAFLIAKAREEGMEPLGGSVTPWMGTCGIGGMAL